MAGVLFSDNCDMTTRALLFDMDGVIVDSNATHRDAWVEFNRRQGVSTTEQMLQRMYGKRNDEIVRDFFGSTLSDAQVFQHGAAKEALYREMIEPKLAESLVPGVREFLEAHNKYPAAVATNAEAANADLVLDRMGMRHFFRAVVDGHQVTHAKPHPEIYLRAAEVLGIPPSECVVFEDSYAGVAAGCAAGMPVIGITTTHEQLPGAILTVADFRDRAVSEWLAQHQARDSAS